MKSSIINEDIAIILLAAGSSSRLGTSKQMIRVGERTLLQQAIDTAQACRGAGIVVVLGADAERHRASVSINLPHVVVNEEWRNGIGSSLKHGLRYVIKTLPGVQGLIVMVCDQPRVSSIHLEKLIETHRVIAPKIVASGYNGTHGVPALFHRSLFGSILEINDDQGAKKIIDANRNDTRVIEFPDGAFDIDTPDDLLKLKTS